MQPADPSVAVVLANNLPAILTALAPIIASVVGLIIAYFNLKAKLAETRDATNKLIDTTKALRDAAVDPALPKHAISLTKAGTETVRVTPVVPEVPEKLL